MPKPVSTAHGIYVANVRSANLVHLNAAGQVQLTLQGGDSPSGLAVTSTGDIAVAGNQQNVEFFHPGQTTPFRTFTDTKLGATGGIAFDGNGDAFVFDKIYSTFHIYGPNASGSVSPLASLHIVAVDDGSVTAFDVNDPGVLYVLTDKPQILTFAFDSASKTFAPKLRIDGSGDFPNPGGISVLPNGDMLVSNASREIVEYDGIGALVKKQPVSELCTPTALRTISHGGAQYAFASNFCGNNGAGSITGYDVSSPPAPGPAGPAFTLAGTQTQMAIARESGIAFDRSGGAADGTLYVTDPLHDVVNGYCFASCFGNVYPSSQLSLGYPIMGGIQAIDFANGLLYTTDSGTPAISILAVPSNSADGTEYPAPIARILSAPGGLCGASYTVVDAQGTMLVSEGCKTTANFIAKFVLPPGVHGDTVLPYSVFAGTPGPCSGSVMCNPQQMTFDASGNLYVTDYGNDTDAGAIEKFSPSGVLLAKMTGADIHNPSGVALDPQGNIAAFSNTGTKPEIAFFAPPASSGAQSVTPIRTIAGAATRLGGTAFPQLAIDRDGTIYADVFDKILVFAPGAGGDVAPSASYTDSLTGGTGLAIAP